MKIVNQQAKVLKPDGLSGGVAMLKAIEYAGRNCYRSHDRITDESYKSFIKSLIRRGHHSPLEFGDITVELITGRDVMAEITRHRMASFAIQSQRYVLDNKEGEISFVRPLFYTEDPASPDFEASIVWRESMKRQEEDYQRMLACGKNPQDARKVLGNSVATVIVMKANLREWLHVFSLRESDAAYPEMHQLMTLLRRELQACVPFVFDEEANQDG